MTHGLGNRYSLYPLTPLNKPPFLPIDSLQIQDLNTS